MSTRVTKTTALLLAILLVSGTFLSAASGEAQSPAGPEYSYRVEADGTAVITAYLGQAETLTVPASLDGHQVRAIDEIAFALCESLVSVTLPEGLISIGGNAFYGCSNLSDITLPEGLQSIGDFAFPDCKSLKNITLPLSLVDIGDNPFAMTAVNINLSPDHPRFEILDGLLVDKTDKRLITYPYSSEASEYAVPEGILAIGDYAFYACATLSAVTLTEGIVSLGEGAFYLCENLTDVTLPLSLAGMALNPFVMAPVNINVSPDHPRYEAVDGVLFDKMEKKLLAYPYGREAGPYTVPQGVLAIEDMAFISCTNLTGITLPEGLLSIGINAFFNCENLAALTISEGLLSIGDNAFYNCGQLTEVALPFSLEEIGFNPFEMVPAVITISAGHPRFEVVDGALFDQAEHRLITYSYASEAVEYTVPDGVLVIGDWAFSSCEKLTALTLPEGLTEIRNSAFNACAGITGITLQDGLLNIGSRAFAGCAGLTSLTVPDGLNSIGEEAFYGCASLTALNVPASVTDIGPHAFTECPNLTLTLQPGSFADTWAHENDVMHMYGE